MKNALLKIHLAVLLWGFTGVLGRVIDLHAFSLVWYRTWLTSLIFLVILLYRSEFVRINCAELIRFAGIGCIIVIHWVAFYASIKFANASIALTCLATAGIFTAILAPLMNRGQAFNYRELIVGFIALVGMYCIYHFDIQYGLGIGLGLVASLLSAVFTILNKRIINNYPARMVAFYEISAGFVLLSCLAPFVYFFFPQADFSPTWQDAGWLFVLSLACTVWGQSLALSALKELSSFTTVLIVNLEPVYGIVLAIIFYQENKELNMGFFIGIGLIAFSVLLHTLWLARKGRMGSGNVTSA